jgi:hypothetical protein
MIETLPRAREAAWREEGRCLPRHPIVRELERSPKTGNDSCREGFQGDRPMKTADAGDYLGPRPLK